MSTPTPRERELARLAEVRRRRAERDALPPEVRAARLEAQHAQFRADEARADALLAEKGVFTTNR